MTSSSRECSGTQVTIVKIRSHTRWRGVAVVKSHSDLLKDHSMISSVSASYVYSLYSYQSVDLGPIILISL
jgi:hypothetical protein